MVLIRAVGVDGSHLETKFERFGLQGIAGSILVESENYPVLIGSSRLGQRYRGISGTEDPLIENPAVIAS